MSLTLSPITDPYTDLWLLVVSEVITCGIALELGKDECNTCTVTDSAEVEDTHCQLLEH